ncbi:MAG: ABC transporter substrate-binding protein [Eubacterium sp.]|nr:ABC transporter substrate-binding protein [Eubacterium sp.]
MLVGRATTHETETKHTDTVETEEVTSEREQVEQTTFVYGSNDYTRINPAMDEHGEINLLLFDGLMAHDGENQVVPGLAKEWDYDVDTCTYTFYLEDGVTWHDGEAFDAEDVKFTIDAIRNPENGSENAPNYEDIEEISVIDSKTIRFRLSAPNVAFLDYMTIPILPQHLLDGEDMQTSDFFRNPVGTGPYRLAEWNIGSAIILEKNEHYFKEKAKIDRVIFKIVPDDQAKALQLKSGELDLALLAPKDAALFAEDENYQCYRMQTSDYRGIMFNFWNSYWQTNRDLIPAICYGIDRQAIVDTVLLGQGMVAYGPLQRNKYNCEEVETYAYEPQKAVELLEAAGCIMGEDSYYYRNGEKVGFTIHVASGDQVRLDIAQIVAQQLGEIGIDVKVEIPAEIDWMTQDAYLIGWGSPFDADDHTYKVFGTEKGANYNGYSNDKVDAYLQKARTSSAPQIREEAYAQFLKELAKDPAFAFICYLDANYVADSGLKGIVDTTIMGHHGVGIFWNIEEWTLEK